MNHALLAQSTRTLQRFKHRAFIADQYASGTHNLLCSHRACAHHSASSTMLSYLIDVHLARTIHCNASLQRLALTQSAAVVLCVSGLRRTTSVMLCSHRARAHHRAPSTMLTSRIAMHLAHTIHCNAFLQLLALSQCTTATLRINHA